MTSNGLRLAGWIWLVPQIVQGVLLLYLPFWRFLSSQVEDTSPATYGALMLLIAAGCLIPVAMETWRAGNKLLGVGTVAAVAFGLVGAMATLATSSVTLAILWAGLNLYPFLIALAFIFTGQYAVGAIRRRLTLHSQVPVKSDRSFTVTRSQEPLPQRLGEEPTKTPRGGMEHIPPFCANLLSLCRETALTAAFAIILTTMVVGIMILGLLNIPRSFWNSQSIAVYLGMFTVIFGPTFALAPVIEWWINAYKTLSSMYHKENDP